MAFALQKGAVPVTSIKVMNPPELAPAVGFAHVTVCAGWVYLGGQISSDVSGTVLFPGDLGAQFQHALTNVHIALRASGCGPEDVVKLTYYVTDMTAYRAARPAIGRAYRRIMGRHYPASSLFEVKGLYEADALIEIECVAFLGGETE